MTYTIRSDSTGVHMSWGDARSWRAVGGRRTPFPQGTTAVVWVQNATSREVAPPKKIKEVAPRYPAAAREALVQGAVVLEASIDAEGRVIDARPLRSIPLLDEAARDAVLQWQYEATLVDGKSAPITLTVTVNFVLREEATNR